MTEECAAQEQALAVASARATKRGQLAHEVSAGFHSAGLEDVIKSLTEMVQLAGADRLNPGIDYARAAAALAAGKYDVLEQIVDPDYDVDPTGKGSESSDPDVKRQVLISSAAGALAAEAVKAQETAQSALTKCRGEALLERRRESHPDTGTR